MFAFKDSYFCLTNLSHLEHLLVVVDVPAEGGVLLHGLLLLDLVHLRQLLYVQLLQLLELLRLFL